MTTRALLRAEIAEDIDRYTMDDTINKEIAKAIRYYQLKRFYFNETRDSTFVTVTDQKLYTTDDSADIPKFIEIDQIYLMDGTEPNELDVISPKEWEMLTASGSATGKPCSWTYFNRSIGFYSIPDGVYTVRIVGHIMKDAPANDDEEGNVWMTEAFDLIRARTCSQIGLKKLRSNDLAARHKAAETDELYELNAETASRIGTGFFRPTEF